MKLSTKTKALNALRLLAISSIAVAMTACGNYGGAQAPHLRALEIKTNREAPKAEDFPRLENATWKQGTFFAADNLRNMSVGLGKDQVRNLLGFPHFSEGIRGASEWNYIFNIRPKAVEGKTSSTYMVCQYMVRFEKDERENIENNKGVLVTTGMYWKEPACATAF